MRFMRVLMLGIFAISLLYRTASAEERLKLSTTTSTQDSGLLKVLLPSFEKQNNVKVDVIAVGTGQALANVDQESAQLVEQLIASLPDRGTTVVMSTHDSRYKGNEVSICPALKMHAV